MCDEWPWTDDDTLPDTVLRRLTNKELTEIGNDGQKKKDPLVMLMKLREQEQRCSSSSNTCDI